MNLRERRHERPPAPQADGNPSDNLDALRAETERLLASGDDAIEQALSKRSEEFLRATRQSGGE